MFRFPPPGKPVSALGQAAPGSIVNTASLEGLSHAVYAMAVQGSKVYSGLYNGNIQVWHMDAYINLPSGSRPEYHTLSGHSSSIYALVVTERQLVSASHDKLIKVWDLNTMRCRHTSWFEMPSALFKDRAPSLRLGDPRA